VSITLGPGWNQPADEWTPGEYAVDAVSVALAAFGLLNPLLAAIHSRCVRTDIHLEFRALATESIHSAVFGQAGRGRERHSGFRELRPTETAARGEKRERAQSQLLLDLLAEDDRLNVYAGELEVRPPCAPTTEPHEEAIDRLETLRDEGGPI
jgi:hypothetical protein